MELIGVDAVSHRHPGNRCPWLIAGFYCALLVFEAVTPSCAHIVSAKKLADTSKRPPNKLLRSKTTTLDGHGRTVTQIVIDQGQSLQGRRRHIAFGMGCLR